MPPGTEPTLHHRWLNDASVLPFKRPIHPGFTGGPLWPDEPGMDRLRHHRSRRPVDRRPDDSARTAPASLAGAYLYGGPLMREFGHFMAESIHRLLPGLAIAPDLPVLFAGNRGEPEPARPQPAFVHELLGMLGLPPERVHVVHRAVRVDRLLVVEQGSDLGRGPKSDYLDLLDRTVPLRLDALAPAEPAPERVYVSRSRLPAGRLLGEGYLEGLLAEAGFHVYRPEEHPLVAQMQVYRQARQLIFSEGSACHGTELLGRQLQHVALLNRRPAPKPGMFRAVLRPRARRYAEFLGNPFVGALPIGPVRPPLAHTGVSVFDVPGLLQFLAAEGLADLHGRFDLGAYAEAARRDFDAHVAWALQHPRTDADAVRDAVPALAQALEAALRQAA
jgi:hypothetical protein